ncbi:MAG: S41 family peptidase [Kordiimonas sp.]
MIVSPYVCAAPATSGIWEINGYNYILEVETGVWNLYSKTSKSCAQIQSGLIETLPYQFEKDTSEKLITLTSGITRYNAYSIDVLPEVCLLQNRAPSFSSIVNFESFWAYFNENYAFFQERGIDWDSAYALTRPLISQDMSEEALWDTLAELIRGFEDGHVNLVDVNRQPTRVIEGQTKRPLETFLETQAAQNGSKGFETEYFSFKAAIKSHLHISRLDQTFSFGNQRLWGGAIAPDIGYLNIEYMYGFTDGDETHENFDAEADSLALKAAIQKMMKRLAHFDGLIIDVRMNPGGLDAAAVEIASHFTTRKRFAFSKSARDNEAFTAPQDVYVKPAKGPVFTKPVILLTSDWTGSAAEVFTLAMRVMPNVKVIGTKTSGGLSDQHHFVLPNGWIVTSSNEKYIAADGKLYEGVGIPPEIVIESFEEHQLLESYVSVIDTAVASLQQQTSGR